MLTLFSALSLNPTSLFESLTSLHAATSMMHLSKRANQTDEDPFWQKTEYRQLFQDLKGALLLPSVKINSTSDLIQFKDELVYIRFDLPPNAPMFGNVVQIPLAAFSPVKVSLNYVHQPVYAIMSESVINSSVSHAESLPKVNMTVRYPTQAELHYLDLKRTVGGMPGGIGGNVAGADWTLELDALQTAVQRQLDRNQSQTNAPTPTAQSTNNDLLYGLLGAGGLTAAVLTAYAGRRCQQNKAASSANFDDAAVPMLPNEDSMPELVSDDEAGNTQRDTIR